MKVIKECPILIGIVLVAIALSIVSFVGMDSVYVKYVPGYENGDMPLLALCLKGAVEEVYPWSEPEEIPDLPPDVPDVQEEAFEEVDVAMLEPSAGGGDAAVSEEAAPGSDGAGRGAEGSFASVSDNSVSGNTVSGNTLSGNTVEVYEFTEVDDDYFTDALFIGDSRTVGLSEYCEPLDTRATFYSKISLTIFDVMKKEFIKTDDGKITVDEALQENEFAKIYIMLGLNEIGTGNAEYFKNAYADVINRIRELQPDAIIYIQGIMHVTAHKSDNDKYFNNDNINTRNAAIAELADNQTIFYIDMNEAVDDENGNLDAELSFDDVHLKASSYERWHQYLLHHAIVR